MKYCNISEIQHDMWCHDHGEYASHVATDGDTPVCGQYAERNGCNCGHYSDRSGESDLLKVLRALSEALGDYDPYDCPEIERRACEAVQEAVDRVINEIKES